MSSHFSAMSNMRKREKMRQKKEEDCKHIREVRQKWKDDHEKLLLETLSSVYRSPIPRLMQRIELVGGLSNNLNLSKLWEIGMELKDMKILGPKSLVVNVGSLHCLALLTLACSTGCKGIGVEIDPQINLGAIIAMQQFYVKMGQKCNGINKKPTVYVDSMVRDIVSLSTIDPAKFLLCNFAGQSSSAYKHLGKVFNHSVKCKWFLSIIE